MSRAFSTASQRLAKWLGFDRAKLPLDFRYAVERYTENGAIKKVGRIESIEILHRNDGSSPVHMSHYNPKDKEPVISVRITPADGSRPRTHHVYLDGTGTIRKGDKREYSTLSRPAYVPEEDHEEKQ